MLYLRTHLQEGVRPGIDLVTYIIYTAHTCRKVRGLGVDLVENKVATLQTNNKKNSQKKIVCMYACMHVYMHTGPLPAFAGGIDPHHPARAGGT
jgi:hypothetical protein